MAKPHMTIRQRHPSALLSRLDTLSAHSRRSGSWRMSTAGRPSTLPLHVALLAFVGLLLATTGGGSGREPVIELRRLRIRLRHAREAANMTQQEVHKETGWPRERILRIEKGTVIPTLGDVRGLASLYKLPIDETEQLIEMAKVAQEPGWSDYKALFTKPYIDYLGLESVADRVSQYHPSIIPGLLQDTTYAERILAEVHDNDSAKDREQLLKARLLRQRILENPGKPHFTFVIDEAALLRIIGTDEVMSTQVKHLVEMNGRRGVTIRVLPFDAGAHPGLRGPFIHLDLSSEDFDDAVFIEGPSGDSMIRDDAVTAETYANYMQRLVERSLPLDEFLAQERLPYLTALSTTERSD